MKQTKHEKLHKTLTEAYNDYEKALLKRSLSKVSDPELGGDLVQITFMKAWEYLLKHGKIDSMKAFLFHILNNLIIDEYRKHKTVSLDALTDKGFQVMVDESERMQNIFDGRKAIEHIPHLSEKYRDVVSMRYVDELSISEIAEIKHQTKNTVAVQIHRGIEKLTQLFTADMETQSFGRV